MQYNPSNNSVEVHGELVCDLKVKKQRMDGSDELIMTFVVPYALVNATVLEGKRPGHPNDDPHMMLNLLKIFSGDLEIHNVTYGGVPNKLLIQQGLQMET